MENNNKKDMSVDEIFRSVTPEDVKKALTPDSVDEDVKDTKASNETGATTPLPEGITEKDIAAAKKLKNIVNFAKSMRDEKSEDNEDNEDNDDPDQSDDDSFNGSYDDIHNTQRPRSYFNNPTRPSYTPPTITPSTAPMFPQYKPTYGLGFLPKRFMDAGYDMFFTPEYMKQRINYTTDGLGYGLRTPGTPDPFAQWMDQVRDRGDKIDEIVTVAEWKTLQGTNFMSSEEDIRKFIAVITKLLDAGIFCDDEDKKSK